MNRTTHSTTPVHTTPRRLSHRLDGEWNRLRRRPAALRLVRGWHLHLPTEGAPSPITDLRAIIDATQASAAGADELLCELVLRARDHELAGRIVLQRILPGLVVGSLRYRRFCDALDPVEIAVPVAWDAIHRYDVGRRKHQVAASLISDTIYRAFRGPTRRRSTEEVVWAPMKFVELTIDALNTGDAAGPLEELASIVREAREAGVPREDLDFVRDLVSEGSPSALAKRRGVTTRTIRNHRDRAVGRIREAVLAA